MLGEDGVPQYSISSVERDIHKNSIFFFLQKSSRKKVPPEPPRIEKLKFTNQLILCFLSATFLHKKAILENISVICLSENLRLITV